MTFVPWFAFVIVDTGVALALHFAAWVAYSIAIFGLLLAALMFMVHLNSGGKQGPYYSYLGFLVLHAVVQGFTVGKSLADLQMVFYWSPAIRPGYTGITPSAMADAYADAGTLQFVEGTHVDILQSLGRWDESSQSMLCVAPVLSKDEKDKAQFWAIGKDCCGHRGVFTCDSASSTIAKTGVVFPASSSWWMSREAASYQLAVEQAAAVYGLHAPDQATLVYWVFDPIAYRRTVLEQVLLVWMLKVAVFLVLSFVLAVILHWSSGRSSAAKPMAQPSKV